jgi:asparagine synthase (glutamine-hydrolysing)
MGTLGGWLNCGAAADAATGVLRQMAAAMPGAATPQAWQAAGAAMQITAPADGGWMKHAGGVAAAIEGSPHWSRSELHDIAMQSGHAAALLEAYRRFGPELLAHLHGPFACAVIDANAKRGLLAVDRLGIRPLCYARTADGGLVFASTADGVKAHPATGATVTAQGIFNYLYFGAVPAPTSIYAEQAKLLPGQYVAFRDGRVDAAFYWQLGYVRDNQPGEPRAGERLLDELRHAFRRSAAGQDMSRAGAFLSGGLDSSTVAGLLSEAAPGGAHTFTIGFDVAQWDESAYAALAAKHFNTRHHRYCVTPADVAAIIPRIAAAYDEPFGNSSAVPTYYCARMAREAGIEVLFAGDGGDEIFAGNARYAEQKIFEIYQRVPAGLRSGLLEPLIRRLPLGERVRLFRRARRYIELANTPLPDRIALANPIGYGAAEIFAPEALAAIDAGAPLAIEREVYRRTRGDSYVQRMMHYDLQVILADNDLRKVNRMCELAGVAVRYPMLDEGLVTFAAGVPPNELVKGFRLRHFYKAALKSYLPAEIINKTKHGFGLPFKVWLREDAALSALARDGIAAFGRRGYLRRDFIADLVANLRPGGNPEVTDLGWVILSLELWLQSHASRVSERPSPSRRETAPAV